jgi:hypothetical protein
MVKNVLLLTLLTINLNISYCQTFEIYGKVIDSSTSLPIPYASVGIRKMGLGAITNSEGKFRIVLPEKTKGQSLSVSFMGYKPFRQNIDEIQLPFVCRLKPDTFALHEVIISPDTLYRLLARAYRLIPRNYPDQPVSYKGFYRETIRANDTLYLNFTEAILQVYKDSYSNNHNFGQIKIEKSRKNTFPGIDTINNIRFFGGPFFPHSKDFVFSRASFINPKYYKRYQYQLLDKIKVDDEDVYVIGFQRHDDTIQNGYSGKLYIEKNTLAYLGVEIAVSADAASKSKTFFESPFYKHGASKSKVVYSKYNGKYHISYVTYTSEGYNVLLDKKDYHELEYITTSIQTDSVKPIPYADQFGFCEVLSVKAQDYSSSFWKGYNILQETNALSKQMEHLHTNTEAEKILAKKYPQKKSKRDALINIIGKLSFSYGIGYLPFSSPGGLYQLSLTNSNGNTLTISKDLGNFNFSMTDYGKFCYSLTRHFAVFYSPRSTLIPNQKHDSYDWGISYRVPITSKGRPWFLDFGLAYSGTDNMIKLSKTENLSDGMDIGNKDLNASKLEVFIGKRNTGIRPDLSITRKTGRFFELFINGSYLIAIDSKDIIKLREASGFFLCRKKAVIPTDNSNVHLTIDNIPQKESNLVVKPFQIIFGIRLNYGL